VPMPIVKLAPNVPLKMKAKFCDIVPGQYGHQVRLKGLVDGEESLVYLPGPVWKNLKALRTAGAINTETVNEEPEKALGISLLEHELELVNYQPAGEKFPSLVVKTNGKPPVSEVENVGRLPNDPPTEEPTKHTDGHTDKPTLEDLVHSYGECLAASVNQYKPWLIEKGVTPDSQTIAAMAATLFIARNHRGI
jgi:hypothetical protein